MEINDRSKEILKVIGAAEKSHSQIQKRFGEDTPIGSDLQLLAQMGVLEEVDGFYSITDAGLKVAALEGTEIPEYLEEELKRQSNLESMIKINKPGVASDAYKRGMGYKKAGLSPAQEKYQAGIRRMLNKESPALIEPVLEGAEETKEPTSVIIAPKGHNACPIFGNASLNFCISMCAGWDNGCGVTDKMAERLKP